MESGSEVHSAGTDTIGEHLVVRIVPRPFFEALISAVGELLPSARSTDLDAIPEEPLDLDVWIDDGDLTRVEIDIGALIELSRGEGAIERGKVPVRIDISEWDADVRVPKFKAKVDVRSFFSLMATLQSSD